MGLGPVNCWQLRGLEAIWALESTVSWWLRVERIFVFRGIIVGRRGKKTVPSRFGEDFD